MPTTINFSMIHLGHSVDLDPIEGNSGAENAAQLIKTYYGKHNPAYEHITTVTALDANSNAVIAGNGSGGGETVSYNLGSGTVTTKLDFAATVNVRVSFVESANEPDYVGICGIIQTAAGDLFLVMIDDDFGLGANSLDNFPVLSVRVTSIVGTGQNQNAAASDGQSYIACFVRGTRIMTPDGPVAIETLTAGDLVSLAGGGAQPIRFISRTRVSVARLAAEPRLRPVRISAGAMGAGVPERDLLVSRQHRMLVSSPIAKRMFGHHDVLVAAIRLTGCPGISVDAAQAPVDYLHLLLDGHQVILAEGAPSESLRTGPEALATLSPADALQVMAFAAEPQQDGPFIPDNRAQKELIARHLRNGKPLQDGRSRSGGTAEGLPFSRPLVSANERGKLPPDGVCMSETAGTN